MNAETPITAAEPAAPLNEEKIAQILEGARSVFMHHGFDAASMNDIARAAGVSKGTLYVYFDSKETLFEALIRAERGQQAEQLCPLDTGADMATTLRDWGHALIALMISPPIIAQVRTVMAAAPKFPRLARTFYESGPKYGVDSLAVYLAKQGAAGLLDVPDPRQAAVHFIQLCQGENFREMMFCVVEEVPAAELTKTIGDAVAVFLRAYAPRESMSRKS
jgi:AcrR family transcriptional regulator